MGGADPVPAAAVADSDATLVIRQEWAPRRAEHLTDRNAFVSAPFTLLVTPPQSPFPPLALVVTEAQALRLEALAVYAAEDFHLDGLRLQFRVIGASSVVLAGWGEPLLAEIVACDTGDAAPRPLAQMHLLTEYGAIGSLGLQRRTWRYTGKLWAARPGEDPPHDPLSHVLEHRFGGPGGALTRIEAGWDQDRLLVRTRHDYPETPCVVWSVSYWELR